MIPTSYIILFSYVVGYSYMNSYPVYIGYIASVQCMFLYLENINTGSLDILYNQIKEIAS